MSGIGREGNGFYRHDHTSILESVYQSVAELTLYTAGGYQKYTPASFNEEMGKLFKLPVD